MIFQQIVNEEAGCLSYLIGCSQAGEAAVVDPARDRVDEYLAMARRKGLTVTRIIDTHLHADHISGNQALADRTGARILMHPAADAAFPTTPIEDEEEIRIGNVSFRVLHTPGHTPESVALLVTDRSRGEEPWFVLTGDTLFVGDVGRVDILSSRLPVQELAGLMYDTLHGKLLELPDETRVFPAHGAGSLCGRNIRRETSSTIGLERETNAALRPMGREQFIAEITRDVPETPVYFLHSRDLNRAGPGLRAGAEMPPLLAPRAFAEAARAGALILDTRGDAAYAAAHPPGALHVGLDGQYASWVGTLAKPEDRLLLIVKPGREEEAVMRLARVGYENIAGLLEGGFQFLDVRDANRDVVEHQRMSIASPKE